MRVQHCIAPILSIAFLFASGRHASSQTVYGQVSPTEPGVIAAADPFAQQAVYDSRVNGAAPGMGVIPAGYTHPGYAPAGYGGYGPDAARQQSIYSQAAYAPSGYPNSAGSPPGWGYPPVGAPGVGADPQAVFMGSMPPYTDVSATPLGLSPPAATMGPWPDISPFENEFNQHYIEGGLWHELTNNGRKYSFSLDYLSTRTRKPKGFVGDPDAQRYLDQVAIVATAAIGNDYVDDFDNIDIPNYNIREGGYNYYNRLDLREMADIFSKGIRGRWGFENADESGFEWEAWWTKDGQDLHDARSEDSTRFTLIPIRGVSDFDIFDNFFDPNQPIFLDTFIDVDPTIDQLVGSPFQHRYLNLRGLPLNDGSQRGVTVPFDMGFAIENRSESAGTSIDYFFTPVVRKKLFRVRPLCGFRYLFIDEEFHFTGIDSGFLYDERGPGDATPPLRDFKMQSLPNGYDDDQDGVVDNPGNQSEEFGGGDALFQQVAPLTIAFVKMKTQSHLLGPEIGLRYSLGGDKVKIWGQSKFALMANREETKLRGDNIGMITRRAGDAIRFGPDLDEITEPEQPLLDPTPGNPNPNAFGETDDHTHISPLLEQGFFIDARVLSVVPVVNRMKCFEEAQFRMGWSIIYVANVAETNNSIVWDGNPERGLFPNLDIERSHWITSNWSFGVSWDY